MESEINSSKVVLCLDLGTKTGWAVKKSDGEIVSGTKNLAQNRFSGGGMRYLAFRRWLNKILERAGKIDEVYFEEVRRHLGVDAAHAYGGFLATLTAWSEENSIPYRGFPVGTIKKFISGKGNASKQEVIDAVKERGHEPVDDNEADAIAILYLALDGFAS